MRTITRLLVLTLALWACATLPAAAQTLLPPHIVSTADTDCLPDTSCAVVVDLRDVNSIGTYIDIGVSGTANFEATIDETTWFSVADDVNAASTQTSDGARYFTNPGYRQFRVRFSAISGNATVTAVRGPSNLRSTATLSGAAQGDGALQDGANAAIEGTIFDLTNSNPLATQIVDATGTAITSFGGGTQYTEADTDASITGNALMFEGAANALVAAPGTAANGLLVDVSRITGTVAVTDNSGSLTVDYATTGSGTATGALRVELPTNGTGVLATVGAVTAITNALPAGTNAIGKLAANSGVDIGDVDVTSSALPTGASTSANQSTEITALQLIDNLPNTIGSTTSGQSGALILGAVTTSAPTYTTAQTHPLSLDTTGALRVVGSAGTTQYAEDAAATDGASLVAIGVIRRDTTPSSSAGTAGDNAMLTADANGRLYTNATLYDAAGAAVTVATDVTEDAAETAGGTGPSVMSVRRDTAASSAGTTGDNATFNTDALGKLWTTGAYAEDAAHTSADTGVFVMAVRNDAGTALAGTTGDYIPLSTDSSGALRVVGSSGTTQFAEDLAHTTGDSTVFVSGIRRDTTPSSSAGTAGDYTAFNLDANGRLYTNTTLYDASGTAIDLATAAVEDAAETAGISGPMVLSVRRDTAASSAGTTGDNATFNTDATGKLWISGGFAEDAAHTSGDIGVAVLGRRIDTLAASSGTSGDYETFNMNAVGALYTAPGGALAHYRTSAGSTEDEHEIKATAGILYSVLITNTNAAARYIRCYNLTAANTTPGTSTVFWGAAIPGATTGAGFAYTFPAGLTFDTALTCAWTTGAADTDVAEVAANEIKATYSYR